MHHAFTARALLKQLPVRIESAAAYGDRLLLGTATGALLVYQVSEASADRPAAVTLIETKKAFARRSVEQLGVIKEAGVLVCLADGLVTLHDLHTLSSATPLNNTKGAHVLALHTGVDHIDGIPTLVSKLAVYAKRKVVVLEWRDAEFYKSFEYASAEKIVAMQFSAPGLLVLSTAREFLTLQLPRGQWDDLFPADTASLRTVAGGIAAGSHGIDASRTGGEAGGTAQTAAAGGGMWASWALSLSGPAADIQPTIARMPGEKLLLCHKDIGVFINAAAKLCRNEHSEPMMFTRAPMGITYTSSYAIAVSRDSGPPASGDKHAPPRFNVEVRNIATQALVQTLLLGEEEPAQVLNGGGGKQVWAVGPHTVWRLLPAPIQQQVEAVLAAEHYDEAISLVAQSDNILESEKDELSTKIRWLRARWLFRAQGRHEDALAEFSALDATPTEAISLCPERIAGDLAEDPSDDELSEDEANTTEAAGDETASHSCEGMQGAWKEALYAVMRYLTEHRRWLQQAIKDDKRELEYTVRVPAEVDDDCDSSHGDGPNDAGASDIVDDNDNALPHVRLKRLAFLLEKMAIPVPAMAQMVDTTLLKVYLECSPGLLGPLLRVQNFCDVEQSEGLLLEHGRFLELVDLYHGKGLYRNALQLLHTQGSVAGSLHGTYSTVRYLLRLPADQFDLILEYLRWPLQCGLDRAQARESTGSESGSEDDEDWPSPTTVVAMVFADDRPAAEAFPRSRVAAFLRQFSSELVVQYLAHVFDVWNDESTGLHDDMVSAYLNLIADTLGSDVPLAEDTVRGAQLRQRLQLFLKSSHSYSPERALAHLPDGHLFEERALVLSRLGRHEHALNLLVFSVASLPLAEQYCAENVTQYPSVFVLLLRILVAGPPPADVVDNESEDIRAARLEFPNEPAAPNTSEQVETVRSKIHRQFVGHLLSAHHQFLPVPDTLPLLPSDIEFSHDMFVYLRSQLCTLDQDMRTSNVVSSLGAAECLQAKRQLRRMQSSFVSVTETRTCPHCLKRIGSGTAFAIIPEERRGAGPSVVHYSCWQRSKAAQSRPANGYTANGSGGNDASASDNDDDDVASEASSQSEHRPTPAPVVEIKWA
ncbi:Vacuolar morphogenesis protein 6 [Coemansia guatemalensis]|uniref:Vacuolar morphogenesis protein 6 n=1 Tax=Coemansia guatemalensis TaxID=2761395 RepID=A0A9W8I171_9FUNG|nr:Vacuolar morphogenesis protein 6 [Coemansia guatemalensis]